jgi:hypothetical protein
MKFKFWTVLAVVAVLASMLRRSLMTCGMPQKKTQTPLETAGKWISGFIMLSQILSKMPFRK